MNTGRILLHFLFIAALVHAAQSSLAAPSVVRIEKRPGGWQLLRNGQPGLVKGAVVGPGGSLNALQQAGANSIRTHAGRLDEAQRIRLKQALAPLDARYDSTVHMLREPFHSPGYHTTLKGGEVHSTRSSLTYAVALLDTGEEPLRQRAEDILAAVIALQDSDPESRTYGIWPWFLEEPLAKMSPPDWNWADFCGVQLLQVALDHRERLSPEMRSKVDAAIRHAARSIQRRNVGPGYTNIAIMGSYVTLVAAELYDWPELRDYAVSRWRKFCDYTRQLGGFSEYNSPTYTVVALQELGRMRLHVRDVEMRRLTEEVYRVAWEEIARHFHAPTRQWAGPHSRSYSTLLRPDVLALISRATDGRVPAPNLEPTITEHRVPVPCPRDLEPRFTTLAEPREQVQTFVKSDWPVIGTTYLDPSFTLGSVNRGDFWNQRRAVLAYWGSASEPSYLHVRFLRDDYDFAAAQCFSAQRQGDVLAAVVFATDGGNTHVSLDRLTNGVVRARDLRLRFELGGAGGKTVPTAPTRLGAVAVVQSGDITLQLAVPYAAFGSMKPRWQAGGKNGVAWLDLVLHSDTEREFRLAEFDEAVLALAVRISHGRSPTPTVSAEVKSNRLALAWDGLRLSVPVCPDRIANLQRQVQWGNLTNTTGAE